MSEVRDVRPEMQFDDLRQQGAAAELGMWTFLATEVLFLGALIAAFTIYRFAHTNAFEAAAGHSHLWIGTINTAILLATSLTMALGVEAVKHGDRRHAVRVLWLTALGGALFLGLKAYEYSLEWEEWLVPGLRFDPSKFPDVSAAHAEQFFVFYFLLTGLHALHLAVGVTAVVVIAVGTQRGAYPPSRPNTVHNVGLYWHFVDVVWVFLYPLIYLMRGAS